MSSHRLTARYLCRQGAREEGAAELMEFMVLLPILLFVGIAIWQLFIGGHAIVVGANAAREGARVLAACDGSSGAAIRQAENAAPEFVIQATPQGGGGEVRMVVRVQVPSVLGEWIGDTGSFWITMSSTMRKERCY